MRNTIPWALVIAVLASACSPYLHSPPARMVPLEPAAALAKGDVAIQGALGGGAAVWGPSVGAGTLQARYGFGRGFEGAAEGGFAFIGKRDSEWDTEASQALFAGRAGFKYAPVTWFALQAGFGGGHSAAGGFISPDVGLIFGYQGKALVPFFAGGFYSSHPINAQSIVFQDQDGDVEVLFPDKTLGGYGNLGLRIPTTRPASDSPRTAVMLAYRFVVASHQEYIGSNAYQESWRDWYHLFVFGFDIVLRKHSATPRSKGGWKLH